MKLLHVRQARSIWLFQVDDINPRGLDLVPTVESIRGRYEFQKYPKLDELFRSQGMHFGNGTFKWQDAPIEIRSLSIYSDGYVADTRNSTEASDAFLNDVITFLTQKYGLAFDEQTVREKSYLSSLIVTSDLELTSISEKLARVADLLSVSTGDSFRTASLRFGTSPASGKQATTFIFEYESAIPHERKRYFSEASVKTDRHLALLNEFEQIVSA